MFWVRYQDTEGGPFTEVALSPGPTDVEYPTQRAFRTRLTVDGVNVVQRPLRDGRTRQWIWARYRPTIVPYENQWQLLEQLEYRARLRANKPPLVYVWEDVTGVGGLGEESAPGVKKWTRVKFLQVFRTVAKGGGLVIYEQSVVEFTIEDETYDAF